MNAKNTVKEAHVHYSLADALFTSTQQKVLGILFGQPDRSFYLTEIIRQAKGGSGAIQKELTKLESSGLVVTKRIGNQKHYQANSGSPLFEELRGIVIKTVGLRQPLLDALLPLASKIEKAFVYGSVANSSDTAASDIDLMVVSDRLELDELFKILSSIELTIGRTINPTIYTCNEFQAKQRKKNSFLSKVLASPRIDLIGTVDD